MQEIIVRRIANPAFDWDGVVCSRSSVRPQFGMSAREHCLTFVENVAHGAVINDHDFAQIRLDLGQILDISPVAKGAMLPIIAARKVLALCFKPIDDGVGIFLHRRSEDD